jgi:hypothetical protein
MALPFDRPHGISGSPPLSVVAFASLATVEHAERLLLQSTPGGPALHLKDLRVF